jgi:hypothetical protein
MSRKQYRSRASSQELVEILQKSICEYQVTRELSSSSRKKVRNKNHSLAPKTHALEAAAYFENLYSYNSKPAPQWEEGSEKTSHPQANF